VCYSLEYCWTGNLFAVMLQCWLWRISLESWVSTVSVIAVDSVAQTQMGWGWGWTTNFVEMEREWGSSQILLSLYKMTRSVPGGTLGPSTAVVRAHLRFNRLLAVLRSTERCDFGTRVHPEDVHWAESRPRQDHLLAFYLCHRSADAVWYQL